MSLFVTTIVAQRIHRAMLRAGSTNRSDFVRELIAIGLTNIEQEGTSAS